jgi:ABC-type branched-subunit amino acid transport system substrate-binding protein
MHLAGDLSEIPFTDVVQFYSQTRRTATLVLNCPRSGKPLGFFYFENGELLHAELGDAEGLDAVYLAMELNEGTFHIARDAKRHERTIYVPVSAMLLEGTRRMDEAQHSLRRARISDVTPSLPLPAPPLQLVRPDRADRLDELGGKDMAAESKGRVCPTCRKRYIHGDICPEDGSRLEPSSVGPVSVETSGVGRTVAPPTALSRRPPLARGWWVALTAAVAGVILLALIWTTRERRHAASAAPAATLAPPAAAGVSPTVVSKPPPAAETAAKPAPPPPPVVGPVVRGVTDTEIHFGISAPLTGPSKELGRQMKMGIETAFNVANEAGGIHGRQVKLIAADDGYEPTRTSETMKQLYDKDQVFGIIGNVGTPTAVVAVPFALDKKMMFFGAFTGASLLRRDPPDRYVFNYRASYAEETDAVVRYLVKIRRLRPEQIAVFAQQDAYGDAGFAGVAKAMRSLRGGDQGAILRLNYKRNTIDVDDAVLRLREHPITIRAVVMVATYRAAAKFIEKTRDLYPQMIYTNVSFVGSTSLADELMLLGAKYANGVIVTQVVPPVDGHSTAILKYKAALAKYFPGENPDFVSLEGYIAGNVMVEGLKRAGRDLDTEKLVDTLEGMRDVDLGIGTLISFGLTEHQGSHKVWGTQIDETGHYQSIDLQ